MTSPDVPSNEPPAGQEPPPVVADPTITPQSVGSHGGETYDQQLSDLRDSSSQLSVDVNALTSTIAALGNIQQRQNEMELAMEHARDRQRNIFLKGALGLLGILFVVTIVVYLLLLNNVERLIDDNNKQAYASCTNRNRTQLENAERETKLAAIETNDVARQIHLDSAKQLRETLSDCARWRK